MGVQWLLHSNFDELPLGLEERKNLYNFYILSIEISVFETFHCIGQPMLV